FGFSFLCMALYFIFANLAVFKSLKQPELILGEVLTNRKFKYESSTLSSSDSEQILKQLLRYMDTQKPYLQPSVSVDDIAKALHVSPRHVSQVINERLNQHFFDFINRYRIEEAKRLISDSTGNSQTMLQILYEIGFNSKSAFNTAFKKHTNMTPREFKRLCETKVNHT
ncbi:helix-turn-helix domain-containing protein, partial [bacterium]|nr:helix-turn-helix domain-containing protein [bacterium]